MKIMYIHGFGSTFSKASEKIQALDTIGDVVGMSYDYTASADTNVALLCEFAKSNSVDVIVGTSLGGWYSAEVGSILGVPSVLINPCVDPFNKLLKYVGTHVDHYDIPYEMTVEAVTSYHPMKIDGCSLVLLDEGDEVISHTDIDHLHHEFYVHRFRGGSHRFDHMMESLEIIVKHVHLCGLTYN